MLAAAPATRGPWTWSLDLPLFIVLATGALYWLGARRTVTPARTRASQRWRDVYFYAGLATLVLALCSPLDAFSEKLFWAHMVQHILLLVVAAPLIVLARPWTRLWRALPLEGRRGLGRGLAQSPRASPLRHASRVLGGPTASFLLFCGVLLAWHVPAMFDATLRSAALHALEHTLFLATALMFWKQVIPSPPLHARLPDVQRVLYVIGAMIVSWGLAVVLALAPDPLYGTYLHEASRPGGISAIADQHLAAGIMWVPGSITFLIVMLTYVHRWLMPPTPGPTRSPGLAS